MAQINPTTERNFGFLMESNDRLTSIASKNLDQYPAWCAVVVEGIGTRM